MSNPKISVLVPVYKVEPYLQRCIDSVLAQDFTDWEMILVDDGSPDNCPRICDENAAKDTRIKVIHKVNEGLPAARLSGWKEAQAKYVIHLDSDDFLLSNALKALYQKAIEGDYDIVKGSNLRLLINGTTNVEHPLYRETILSTPNEYLKALVSYKILPYIWGGIYKRSLFTEEIFKEARATRIGEDLITNIGIWKNVNNYITIDNIVCSYFINSESMMQSLVMTHKYHDFLCKKIHKLSAGCDESTKQIIIVQEYIRHIRCFFMPELKWDEEWYKKLLYS